MLLRATGISKAYAGKAALEGVDVSIDRGECVGVIGQNGAGKSTLVGILGGALRPDAGTIEWEGRAVTLRSPADAAALGIGVVHQHDTLVPRFSVAENLALAAGLPRFPRRAELAARARDLAARYGLDPGDPDAPCEGLSVGARQRAEILKALARPTKLLLLDEPTAVLAPAEVAELLAVVKKLREAGVALVLVDHKLHEVVEVCTRTIVLRAGRVVAEVETARSDPRALATTMVGHPLPAERRPAPPRGGVALEVRGVRVAAGEILGIAGVDGNGQEELVEELAGSRAVAAIAPDRRLQGLVLDLPLGENLLLDEFLLADAAPRGWLAPSAVRASAEAGVARLSIAAPSLDAPARALSGGNQQKVVIARALARAPKVIVAAHPTRGLDVDAAAAVHAELLAFAENGGAVVLVSADLDEIAALAHRAIVLDRGRAVGPFDVPLSRESLERIAAVMAGAAR